MGTSRLADPANGGAAAQVVPLVAARALDRALDYAVPADLADRVVTGRAEALDEDGALLVRTEHGRLEHIIGGDVSLAK